MPVEIEGVNPKRVRCSHCHVLPGQKCRTEVNNVSWFHAAREEDAKLVTADECFPGLGYHSTPHVNCIMR